MRLRPGASDCTRRGKGRGENDGEPMGSHRRTRPLSQIEWATVPQDSSA